ncbi:MAG: caspase family protein [Alphaproteobacteria bacterium]
MTGFRDAFRSLAPGALRVLTAVAVLIAADMPSNAADDGSRTHALLVGVSAYQNLPQILHLEGPRNDVAMWRDLLHARGVPEAQIAVLADGVDGADLPTRAAIFAALDTLTQTVGPGDNVFLLLAGHGSQQVQGALGDTTEADGLDEIFLPYDAGRWNGQAGTVENAIVDDEFGWAIDALRAQGAFVWVVFDACHSGTMDRGADPGAPVEERDRGVEPAALGVPLDGLVPGGGDVVEGTMDASAADLPGGLVAFYAAQSWERAPEKLYRDENGDRAFFGLFSRTLAQTVIAHPSASFADLIGLVQAHYIDQGRSGPTPLAQGSALDLQVFF